jgi:hypothetical protein
MSESMHLACLDLLRSSLHPRIQFLCPEVDHREFLVLCDGFGLYDQLRGPIAFH